MEVLLSDIRLAVRRLVRDPLFAVIAISTLAIGIGANSAIFTLVNGALLWPLAVCGCREALAASVLPAWRAARTSPAAVLNAE